MAKQLNKYVKQLNNHEEDKVRRDKDIGKLKEQNY